MDTATGKKHDQNRKGTRASESRPKVIPGKRRQYARTAKMEHPLDERLGGIQTLLSHLHGEVTALETSYNEVLQVLRRLEGACETDDLTGLLRRRPFFSKWEVLLEECRRLNDECGVILIDIDHFKKVNDTYGHPTGDEVIKRIASMLKQYQSPRCVASRYGGEEFAVAYRGNDAEVQQLAEKIRRDVEGIRIPAISNDGSPSSSVDLSCTLSMGVSSTQRAGFDVPRLLQSADEALYAAKRSGRNRVKVAA